MKPWEQSGQLFLRMAEYAEIAITCSTVSYSTYLDLDSKIWEIIKYVNSLAQCLVYYIWNTSKKELELKSISLLCPTQTYFKCCCSLCNLTAFKMVFMLLFWFFFLYITNKLLKEKQLYLIQMQLGKSITTWCL